MSEEEPIRVTEHFSNSPPERHRSSEINWRDLRLFHVRRLGLVRELANRHKLSKRHWECPIRPSLAVVSGKLLQMLGDKALSTDSALD